MKQWWISRSARERFLVATAVFLLAGGLIWQFGIKPSFASLDRAKLKHQRASQVHERLDRLEEMLRQGTPVRPARAPAPASADHVRTDLTALLASSGLVATSTESIGSGNIRITLRGAAPAEIFAWIEHAETRLGVSAVSADLRQNAAGNMDAEVEFSAGSPQ